jgi:hypothetical protein
MTTTPTWTTDFVVPSTKKYKDPPFNLTNPTSNSSGAFIYSINNTNIAEISGNTVIILGTGTTSITVTQTASGIYTSKSVSVSFVVSAIPPTLQNFILPKKELNDSSFNITDPSSNSVGQFTYISSNPNVATINGRVVTIRGIGESVIIATQAAYGNYTSGTISAELTVFTSIVRTGVQNQLDLSWNIPVNNGSTVKNYFFYSEERASSSISSVISNSYDAYLMPVPYSAPFLSSGLLPSGFDVNEQGNSVILSPAVAFSTTNYFDLSYNAEVELTWNYHGDRPITDICANSVSQTTMTLSLYKRNMETNDRVDLLRSYERTYDSFTNGLGAIPQNNGKLMKDVFSIVFDADITRNLLYMKKDDTIEGTIEFSDLYYYPSSALALTDEYKQKYSIIVRGVRVAPYRIPYSQDLNGAIVGTSIGAGGTVYYARKLTRPLTHFNEAKMSVSWTYQVDISNAMANTPNLLPSLITDFNAPFQLRVRCYSRSFRKITSAIIDASYNTPSASEFLSTVSDTRYNTYLLFDISRNYTASYIDVTVDPSTNQLPVVSTTFDLSGVSTSTFPASAETNDPAHTQFVYVFSLAITDTSYNMAFKMTPFQLNFVSHTFMPQRIYRFSGPDPTISSSNLLTSPTKTVYDIDTHYYEDIRPFYRFYNLTNGNYYSYRIASNNIVGTSAFSQLLTRRCGSVPNMIVNIPGTSSYYFSESERLSNKISVLWHKPDFSGFEILYFVIQINVDVFGRWVNNLEYTPDLSLNTVTFDTFEDLVIPVSAHVQNQPNDYRYDIQNVAYRTLAMVQAYTDQTGIPAQQYGSLINGNKYYLRMTAANELGIANYSSVLTGIPITRPENAPARCIRSKDIVGDKLVYISWKIPDDDGGAPILNYIIDYQELVEVIDANGNLVPREIGPKYRYNQNAAEPTEPTYPKDKFVAIYNALKNRSTMPTNELNDVLQRRDALLQYIIPPTPITLFDPDKNLAETMVANKNVVLTYTNRSFTYISDELTQNVFDISNIQLKWYYFQDNSGSTWADDTVVTFTMSIRGHLTHVSNSTYDISNVFYIPDTVQYAITKTKLSVFGTYYYISHVNGNIISNSASVPKAFTSTLPRIDSYKEDKRYKLKLEYEITSISNSQYKFILYSGPVVINGIAPVRTNASLNTIFTMKLVDNPLSPLDNSKFYRFTITPFNIADYFPTYTENTTDIKMGISTADPIQSPSYILVQEPSGGKVTLLWSYAPSVSYYLYISIPSNNQNANYPNEYPFIEQLDGTTRSIETPNLTSSINKVVTYSIPSTHPDDIQSGNAQEYLKPGRAYTITVSPFKTAELNGINIRLVAQQVSITSSTTFIVPFTVPLRPKSLSAFGYNGLIVLSWKLPNWLNDPNYYISDELSPFYGYRYYALEMRNITIGGNDGLWTTLSDRISIPEGASEDYIASFNASTNIINENNYQFRVRIIIQNDYNGQFAFSNYTYITQVNNNNIPENVTNTIYPSLYPYKPSPITLLRAARGAGPRVLYIEFNLPVYTGNATEYECFIEYSANNSVFTWISIFDTVNGIANTSDNTQILTGTGNSRKLVINASSGGFYSVSITCKTIVLSYAIRVRLLGKIAGVAEPYANPNLSYSDYSDVAIIPL